MNNEVYSLTVPQLLSRTSQLFPKKEVMYDGERRMTYSELETEVHYLASALKQQGIVKGDRIAVCLPNWHEFVVIFLAGVKLGAIIVPFNTRYKEEEVSYIVGNSAAKIAFFTEGFSKVNHYEQFMQAKKRNPSLEKMVTVRFLTEGLLSYDQLLQQGKESDLTIEEAVDNEDICTILYTSGTTGMPKGAMLTHRNVVHTATVTAEALRTTVDDVLLVPVPVFHVFGLTSILGTLSFGMRMVLMDEYRPESALRLIQEEGITIHHGVPTMFILELNHPKFSFYNLSTLRTGIIAAAPCPVEIVKRIRMDMGCNIIVCYGLSETSPTLTATGWDDDDIVRSETVGRAFPGAELKIVDENRKTLPRGQVGEIACRSFGVMKGYFNASEQTRNVLDETSWFYTGDLGTMDDQGYIRIVGRKKEMIIRGGYNIYPREVEEVLYTHPAVLEVAIVGLPDTVLGEISCAAVRLKEGYSLTEEQLRPYVKERIADYKVPDKILFLDEFPMTASGKIIKIALQKQLQKQLKVWLR